jgi:hypothetical protein
MSDLNTLRSLLVLKDWKSVCIEADKIHNSLQNSPSLECRDNAIKSMETFFDAGTLMYATGIFVMMIGLNSKLLRIFQNIGDRSEKETPMKIWEMHIIP